MKQLNWFFGTHSELMINLDTVTSIHADGSGGSIEVRFNGIRGDIKIKGEDSRLFMLHMTEIRKQQYET